MYSLAKRKMGLMSCSVQHSNASHNLKCDGRFAPELMQLHLELSKHCPEVELVMSAREHTGLSMRSPSTGRVKHSHHVTQLKCVYVVRNSEYLHTY
jgi:hypothetical protein